MTTFTKTTLSGGKREGSGRKTLLAEKQAANDYQRLIAAKADLAETSAARNQLKLKREAGALCELSEVMQLYTTTVAVFAEQMRSLPDMLERKVGLSPKQAEMAAEEVDNQLEQLKARLITELERIAPDQSQ